MGRPRKPPVKAPLVDKASGLPHFKVIRVIEPGPISGPAPRGQGRPPDLKGETRFAMADNLIANHGVSEVEAIWYALRMDFPDAAIPGLLENFTREFHKFQAGKLKRHIGGPAESKRRK